MTPFKNLISLKMGAGGSGGGSNFQTKSVSYTPSESQQTAQVKPDSGYDALSKVNVTVDAIPSEYVIPTGTKSIEENGKGIDVSAFAAVDVNVSGGGGGAEDFVRVVEGTGTSYSNADVTAVKKNAFRDDTSVESISFPNVTNIDGNAFYGASALKSINMPNVATFGDGTFAETRKLIRASFQNAINNANSRFKNSYMLVTGDYGPGVTKLSQEEFFGTLNLSELVLRKTDAVVTMQNTNNIGTNHMTLVQQKIGHVYVPDALKSTYQSASNWSTFYGLNPDIFRSLESYTVDGTISGELDYSKIWTPHTPAYSLEDEEFDGTKVIDTGVQLFDGGSGEFTIVFSITGNSQSTAPTNGASVFSCLNSSGNGLSLNNNGWASNASKYVTFKPNSNGNMQLLNLGTYANQLGFIRSSGLDAVAVLISSSSAERKEWRLTGSVETLSETLLVGGCWISGVATAQWKGTINMLKVYKACLNPNEIIDLLGLED